MASDEQTPEEWIKREDGTDAEQEDSKGLKTHAETDYKESDPNAALIGPEEAEQLLETDLEESDEENAPVPDVFIKPEEGQIKGQVSQDELVQEERSQQTDLTEELISPDILISNEASIEAELESTSAPEVNDHQEHLSPGIQDQDTENASLDTQSGSAEGQNLDHRDTAQTPGTFEEVRAISEVQDILADPRLLKTLSKQEQEAVENFVEDIATPRPEEVPLPDNEEISEDILQFENAQEEVADISDQGQEVSNEESKFQEDVDIQQESSGEAVPTDKVHHGHTNYLVQNFRHTLNG